VIRYLFLYLFIRDGQSDFHESFLGIFKSSNSAHNKLIKRQITTRRIHVSKCIYIIKVLSESIWCLFDKGRGAVWYRQGTTRRATIARLVVLIFSASKAYCQYWELFFGGRRRLSACVRAGRGHFDQFWHCVFAITAAFEVFVHESNRTVAGWHSGLIFLQLSIMTLCVLIHDDRLTHKVK